MPRHDALGFAAATGRDEVFKALVLARIIEPTSKLDSLRVGPVWRWTGLAGSVGLKPCGLWSCPRCELTGKPTAVDTGFEIEIDCTTI